MANACVCYWLEHGARDGAVNMAVDQWLLERAQRETGWAAFRVYRWRRPTISLGYFQRADSRPARLRGLPYVRRLTGGGAILHDREITYSLVASADHVLYRMGTAPLYRRVHAVLAAAMAEQTVGVALRGDVDRQPAKRAEPFLCFVRQHRTDLVLDRVKVVGSAQRRRTRALLQHGSLVLEASAHAPGVPGIADLCGVRFDATSLVAAVHAHLGDELGLAVSTWPGRLDCWSEVRRLVRETYGAAAWNDMR